MPPVIQQNYDKVTGLAIPALYDDTILITGAYLIEKVKRSKRQRGYVLQNTVGSSSQIGGTYNGAYVNAHSAVMNNCIDTNWGQDQQYGDGLPPGTTLYVL